MLIPYICVFILTFVSTVLSSDFSLKGDPCSKHDSCFSKPASRTCSCDSSCHIYGTCCQDFKKSDKEVQDESFHCFYHRTTTPVFAKRSCSEDFRGHVGVKRACFDNDEDEMDIKNNLLVTSYKTKITYWNKHCAECSKEAAEDLELWNIEVFCPSLSGVDRHLIRRNLTFDQDKGYWGLQLGDEFLKCVVKYAPPTYIDEPKHCTPNLISSCPEDYKDEDVAMKCSQYYAQRKHSNIYYKNIHCAICNDVKVEQLQCSGMVDPLDDAEESDFGEMVEEIFTKGHFVWRSLEKTFECSKGYAYDAFRTKCRRDETLDFLYVAEVPNTSYTITGGCLTLLAVLFSLLIKINFM